MSRCKIDIFYDSWGMMMTDNSDTELCAFLQVLMALTLFQYHIGATSRYGQIGSLKRIYYENIYIYIYSHNYNAGLAIKFQFCYVTCTHIR